MNLHGSRSEKCISEVNQNFKFVSYRSILTCHCWGEQMLHPPLTISHFIEQVMGEVELMERLICHVLRYRACHA